MAQAARTHIIEPIYTESGSVRFVPTKHASLVLDAEAERFGNDGRLRTDSVRLSLSLTEAIKLRRTLARTIRQIRAREAWAEAAVLLSPVRQSSEARA